MKKVYWCSKDLFNCSNSAEGNSAEGNTMKSNLQGLQFKMKKKAREGNENVPSVYSVHSTSSEQIELQRAPTIIGDVKT